MVITVHVYLVATTSICSQHRIYDSANLLAVGAWVPVSQLAEEEVTAFRQLEEDKIGKVLDNLLDICKSEKVETSSSSSIPFPTCQCQHEPAFRFAVLVLTDACLVDHLSTALQIQHYPNS